MVGKCNIEKLKKGLYEIINDKSYYGEDEEVYIEILGNHFCVSDNDIEYIVDKLLWDNSLMYGDIYVMDTNFTDDEINDIENIEDIEEIESYEINSYMSLTKSKSYMMYIGYTPYVEESYSVYLKKATRDEDGRICFF